MAPVICGIDPGVKKHGIAIGTLERIYAVGVAPAEPRALQTFLSMYLDPKRGWGEVDLVVVEGQEIYPGSKARPNDQIALAQSAGICGGLAIANSTAKLKMPAPREWKQQQPKKVNQGRTFVHYGILYRVMGGKDPYVVPSGCAACAAINQLSPLVDS